MLGSRISNMIDSFLTLTDTDSCFYVILDAYSFLYLLSFKSRSLLLSRSVEKYFINGALVQSNTLNLGKHCWWLLMVWQIDEMNHLPRRMAITVNHNSKIS